MRVYGGIVPIGLWMVEAVPTVGVFIGFEVGVFSFIVVRHGVGGLSGWPEKGTVSGERRRGSFIGELCS